MSICFNFDNIFFQTIKSDDLLTYLALMLAYIAYTWSVNRGLEAWKSLFISFKNDIETQRDWLSSEYFKETYENKHSFNPYKIIFPLSFESMAEIIKRGASELPCLPKGFLSNLSIFNERVLALNDLLSYLKHSATSDPIVSERLKDKLNNLGLHDEKVDFEKLKAEIFKKKNTDPDFYLAEQVRRINRIIHSDMIGNKTQKDRLHYLFTKIDGDLNEIIKNFDKNKPFFIKHQKYIITGSAVLFYLIEIFLS